jgi:hypothetical protein
VPAGTNNSAVIATITTMFAARALWFNDMFTGQDFGDCTPAIARAITAPKGTMQSSGI